MVTRIVDRIEHEIEIDLGVERITLKDLGGQAGFIQNLEELLKVEIRKTFNAGQKIGVCCGGKYTPYITIFVPADMGFSVQRYVRPDYVTCYTETINAGKCPDSYGYVSSYIFDDTRVRMAHLYYSDEYAKIMRFSPGKHEIYYLHGNYRVSRNGNPCFDTDTGGKQTLVRVPWQNNRHTQRGKDPEVRWNLVSGNPPPGVPKRRQHNWDPENVSGYYAPEILVPVPENYLKFAALTQSNNHGAGVMWFILDRVT